MIEILAVILSIILFFVLIYIVHRLIPGPYGVGEDA